MIETPTVLILGAGASQPYGFPLGRGLRDLVCAIEGPLAAVVAAAAGVDTAEAENFVNTLRHSAYTSVDWFLEDRREFVSVGKAAIAAALIPHENPDRLFPPHAPEDSWYELLVNTMDNPQGAFARNRLSIITFNYDRSLEYYLFRVLETRRRSTAAAIEELSAIPIVHVHGSLGKLPTLETTGREYLVTRNQDTVRAAAEQIFVVGEASDDSETFNEARALIRAAKRIAFLGFGFHAASVRRLGVFNEPWDEERRQQVRVNGTIRGFSARAWQQIAEEVLHNAIPPRATRSSDVYHYLFDNEPLDA